MSSIPTVSDVVAKMRGTTDIKHSIEIKYHGQPGGFQRACIVLTGKLGDGKSVSCRIETDISEMATLVSSLLINILNASAIRV